MTRTKISEIILKFMTEYVSNPILNIGEHDIQSELLCRLRICINEKIEVNINLKSGPKKKYSWNNKPRKTSRVHTETKITNGGKNIAGLTDKQRVDLMVFKNKNVDLLCHKDGPLAIVTEADISDVNSVIELKSTTVTASNSADFIKDIKFLFAYKAASAEVSCFQVFFNTSLSLGCVSSTTIPTTTWQSWVTSEGWKASQTQPQSPFVEVFYIDPVTLIPTMSYVTQS